MFSGGDYHEVARWLANFATSHAKREDLRAECVLDTEGAREGKSYGLRVRVGERLSSEIELEFAAVTVPSLLKTGASFCRSGGEP